MKKNIDNKKSLLKIILKISNIIFTTILIIFILFLVTLLVLKKDGNTIHIGDYYIFKIATGSMHPTLKIDDLVLVKKTDDYKVDDIITYYEGTKYVTHRLIKIENGEYITKGDHNNVEDDPIKKEEIFGKVISNLVFFRILYELCINPFVMTLIVLILILINILTRKDKKHVK